MKILLLVVAMGVVCILSFLAGVISPGRSRRMQKTTDRLADKGGVEGERKAGKLGDLASNALKKSRNAMDRSAEKGREAHDQAGTHWLGRMIR